jgi:hypothetical protein
MQTANNNIFSSKNAASGVWRNINNWQAFSIHVTGVESKVWVEVSNDPNVLTDGATINAPAAPVLTQFTPTTDMHVNGEPVNVTYYVKNTYVTPGGETVASAETSLLVTAGNLLVVQSPALDTGKYAVAWNTYISKTAGTEVLQNLEDNAVISPISFGRSFILKSFISSGISTPGSNTSGSPNAGINVTPPDLILAGGTGMGTGYLDMSQLIYDSTTAQAIWTPSCLVYNYIRVCKSADTQVLTTNAYLFGQLG